MDIEDEVSEDDGGGGGGWSFRSHEQDGHHVGIWKNIQKPSSLKLEVLCP